MVLEGTEKIVDKLNRIGGRGRRKSGCIGRRATRRSGRSSDCHFRRSRVRPEVQRKGLGLRNRPGEWIGNKFLSKSKVGFGLGRRTRRGSAESAESRRPRRTEFRSRTDTSSAKTTRRWRRRRRRFGKRQISIQVVNFAGISPRQHPDQAPLPAHLPPVVHPELSKEEDRRQRRDAQHRQSRIRRRNSEQVRHSFQRILRQHPEVDRIHSVVNVIRAAILRTGLQPG